jgi:hypothetical protein
MIIRSPEPLIPKMATLAQLLLAADSDVDTLRRAPIGDTPEAVRAVDEALCALECAVHGNAADIEDIAARLQAGGDALRGHIMAQVLEALAQRRSVREALTWFCASGLAQPEVRRLLSRRALSARKDTALVREGLRAQEALAWERQRVVFEAALRGGHHARADAMLWHSLVPSPVLARDAAAAERLRATVNGHASVTQRRALEATLQARAAPRDI